MPAADETALVAAALPNTVLAPVIIAAWDAGEAVLALNPALPPAELDRLVELARPTHVIDADGTRTARADGRCRFRRTRPRWCAPRARPGGPRPWS